MWGRFLKHVGWALDPTFRAFSEIPGNFREFPEISGNLRKFPEIQEFPEIAEILYGFPSSFSAREVPARPPAASGWR